MKASQIQTNLKCALSMFILLYCIHLYSIHWLTRSLEGPSTPPHLILKVISSPDQVLVQIDDRVVLNASGPPGPEFRGMHVAVLNEATGRRMATRLFDLYYPGQNGEFVDFVESISDRRIIVFAIKEEASRNMELRSRELLKNLGSEFAQTIVFRSLWIFVVFKHKRIMAEKLSSPNQSIASWPAALELEVTVKLMDNSGNVGCRWQENGLSKDVGRRQFCQKYEGYAEVCRCHNAVKLGLTDFNKLNAKNETKPDPIGDVAIIIMASHRPWYLYWCLQSLFSADLIRRSHVLISINGFDAETLAVAALFKVNFAMTIPRGLKNSRISQHYRDSLRRGFDHTPHANYALLLEEDLIVSSDILAYFAHFKDLLNVDSSLYCISSWNDNGYRHTSSNESQFYRVEGMPGLGWMLTKELYQEELEPHWPSSDLAWDWDMWMRSPGVRKGRECLVPDVSRTYHIGTTGLNINPYFQFAYFKSHAFKQTKNQADFPPYENYIRSNYDHDLVDLISSAEIYYDQKYGSPCSLYGVDTAQHHGSISNPNDVTVPMNDSRPLLVPLKLKATDVGDYKNWLKLAQCWHIWDIDVRGVHEFTWRLHLRGRPVIVVGVPASPFSVLVR